MYCKMRPKRLLFFVKWKSNIKQLPLVLIYSPAHRVARRLLTPGLGRAAGGEVTELRDRLLARAVQEEDVARLHVLRQVSRGL